MKKFWQPKPEFIVWQPKPEFSSTAKMGYKWLQQHDLLPDPNNLEKTHDKIATVITEDAFYTFLSKLDISIYVGDVIANNKNQTWIADNAGYKEIPNQKSPK